MIVTSWDYRISDIANACKKFIEETEYPITYSEENTLRTLRGMLNHTDTELIVDYSGDTFNGYAVVQVTDEFHNELFGYLSKFYVLPERRHTRAALRLMQEAVNWFDFRQCVCSFATATAGIGRDNTFIKLLSRFGYTITTTGMLIRKQYVKI